MTRELIAALAFALSGALFAATGDVVIDTIGASGKRVPVVLPATPNYYIGLDGSGNVVVKQVVLPTITLSGGASGSGTTSIPVTINAAGSNTQLQFNDGGALGGDSGLVYDKVTNTLTAGLVQLGNDGGLNGSVRLWDEANEIFRELRVNDGEWSMDGMLLVNSLITANWISAGDTISAGGQLSTGAGLLFDSVSAGDTVFNAATGFSGTRTVTWSPGGSASIALPAGSYTLSGTNLPETLSGQKTFTASSTQAGLVLGALAGDPGSGLVNGGLWYNSSTHTARLRVNGSTQSLLHTGSTIGASQLPAPGTGTLGGVMRNVRPTGGFVMGINSSGQLEYETPAGGGGSYNATITSISGGVAGALNFISTTSLSVGTLITIFVSSELQDWVLTSSTAPSTTGIQRPLDYNSSTNAKVWIRRR